ncbi:MAG TPA: hypothetical protein VFV95_06885 [Vicinamibacterales bacterium]|nr:hypothetical protein [Vicinamibacterales bacterium]
MRVRRRVIAAVVFLAIWGLITHGTFAGSGDEAHYLIAAQSLAFDGDFDLANNYAMPGNLIGGGTLTPDDHARPGIGGVLRPAHDVGLPIVFAPYVRIVYPLAEWLARTLPAALLKRARLDDILIFRHLISLAMAVIAVALALQLFEIFRRSAASDAAAQCWAMLIALSPPVLSLAFLFFTELPSALIILWLFRLLSDPDERRPPWFLVGAAIGFLLLLHVRNIAAVAALIAWSAVRLSRTRGSSREWTAWGAALAALLLLRAAIVHAFWGTWLTTPMAVAGDAAMPLSDAVREMFVRTTGLLFDQEFGLLTYAPIYLLAAPSLLDRRTRERPGVRPAFLLAAAYGVTVVVPYINIHGWIGGWSPPARMVMPVVPLLAVPVVAWTRSVRGVRAAVIAAIVSLQIVIDAVVWQWPKALWNYEDGTSALLESVPALQRMLPAWNGPSVLALRFVVFLIAWAAMSMLLARRGRDASAPSQ